MTTTVMVDDHGLIRKALAEQIDSLGFAKVIGQFSNGKELIAALQEGLDPELIILDLNMKEMNGIETSRWLKQHRPDIKVLILTMFETEFTLVQILQAGARGIVHKSAKSTELKVAIDNIINDGFYYSNYTSSKLVGLIKDKTEGLKSLERVMLDDREIDFLKLVCTDKTYKEVALELRLNPRAVDSLRDQLFVKLDVKSRVGLAMIALKHGIVPL
ncbi:MAG: DNA-binding response regulator [Chitinophagales bacterium]|jgi:DNA-binding NarL/FixJ family response regulator|nr:DNA-binding response regulator [Chitinophagales bacterium]